MIGGAVFGAAGFFFAPQVSLVPLWILMVSTRCTHMYQSSQLVLRHDFAFVLDNELPANTLLRVHAIWCFGIHVAFFARCQPSVGLLMYLLRRFLLISCPLQHAFGQWLAFSRCICWVTPKCIWYYELWSYFQNQRIEQQFIQLLNCAHCFGRVFHEVQVSFCYCKYGLEQIVGVHQWFCFHN